MDLFLYVDTCKTVLNVAGPYSKTFVTVVKACIANGLSYLDVTGEIDVFEAAQLEYSQPAKDKGIARERTFLTFAEAIIGECCVKHLFIQYV